MPDPARQVSGQEAIRALERLGFVQVRQKGSHVVLKRQTPEGEIGCVVPLHRELAIGTLRGIVKQARVTPEELARNLQRKGRAGRARRLTSGPTVCQRPARLRQPQRLERRLLPLSIATCSGSTSERIGLMLPWMLMSPSTRSAGSGGAFLSIE